MLCWLTLSLGPLQASVFPLVNKDELAVAARTLSAALTATGLANVIDTTGMRIVSALSTHASMLPLLALPSEYWLHLCCTRLAMRTKPSSGVVWWRSECTPAIDGRAVHARASGAGGGQLSSACCLSQPLRLSSSLPAVIV